MNRDLIVETITKLEFSIDSIEFLINKIDSDIDLTNMYNQIELIKDKINYLNYLKDHQTIYDYKVRISPTSIESKLCILLHKKGCTKRVRLSNLGKDSLEVLQTLIDYGFIYPLLYNMEWCRYIDAEINDEVKYILDKILSKV